MAALGAEALGVEPLAGTHFVGAPTVVLTQPGNTVTSSSLTFSFSFTSPVSRTQHAYRAQLRSQDGSTVFADTGVVESSSSTSLTLDFLLNGGSTYQLWVQAFDEFDWSDWATGSFTVELPDVTDHPDEKRVGSVFEIGINGNGYMLSDGPEQPVERRSTVLEPPRFATGNTPFSEAIERYSFIGLSDFTGGAGQRYADREGSDPSRFFDSEGVNPFEDDCLQLLPDTVTSITDDHTDPHAVVAGDRVYMCSADGELKSQSEPEGTVTTFSITGAGAVTDMTSDGTNWYYADGSDIFRNSSAADPSSAWSTVDAELVEWCVDRLAAVYDDGAGNLCVTTLADAGTEEVSGGRFKYPDTVSIPAITAGDGYMWFVVNRDQQSQVHFWQIGSSDTYAAAGLTLPAGQRATALGFYLGSVFVRAVEPLESGYRVIIYRCVPSSGLLTASRVCSWTTTADPSVGGFAGDDRFVLFNWSQMSSADGYSGLGAIDLSSGGWAKWVCSSATGDALRPVNWGGRLAFPVVGTGLVVEDDETVAEGFFTSSQSDLASGLAKIIDEITVSFDPLPSGGSVAVDYSTDGGGSFTSAGDDVDGAGASSGTWAIGKRSRTSSVRVTLGSSGTSPCVRFVQTQIHAEPLVDELVVLPVNCSDTVRALNGSEIPYTTSGAQRARALESLVGSRVRLQDTDWPVTQTATVWDVVDARTIMTGVFDRNLNRRVESGTVNLTLRRSA